LAYSEFKNDFTALYGGLVTHAVQILNGVPELPPNSLATKFPSTNAIAPHLFGSVVAFSRDEEGFLLESYGTFGGGVLPGGDISGIGVMGGFLFPALAKSQEAARRTACMNNVRQIGLAMHQYAADHGKYPDSFEILLKEVYLTSTRVFICPSSKDRPAGPGYPVDFKNATLKELKLGPRNCSYVMVKGVTPNSNAGFIVVHDKSPRNHGGRGRNCFHVDGHVKWYPEVQFQVVIEAQQAQMKKARE